MKNINQQGQTLIETLVAALVLVMGISAAVGLAIYGLQATSGVTKQLVGIGLAREGVEAVKNIRDSNWLSSRRDENCYDFYSGTSVALCYPSWLSGISTGTTNTLVTNGVLESSDYWQLSPTSSGGYGLDYNPNPDGKLFYTPSGSASGSSGFSRKISIDEEGSAPFNQNLGPRIKVRVDVWWTDDRCEQSDDVPASSGCKITLETYLTNWKNY